MIVIPWTNKEHTFGVPDIDTGSNLNLDSSPDNVDKNYKEGNKEEESRDNLLLMSGTSISSKESAIRLGKKRKVDTPTKPPRKPVQTDPSAMATNPMSLPLNNQMNNLNMNIPILTRNKTVADNEPPRASFT